jgi:hypothetical protein
MNEFILIKRGILELEVTDKLPEEKKGLTRIELSP